MRFPTWDIHRAFPELDAFDDDRCRAYVRLARRKRWHWMFATLIVQTMVVVFGVPFLMLAQASIVRLALHVVEFRHGSPFWFTLTTAFGMAFVVGPLLIVVLTMRDFTLRRAVRAQLGGAKCDRCSYLLLGLPVIDGVVTCPECGFDLVLARFGLTEADLMAERAA